MRVELILEAIDKASAVIKSVEAAEKGVASASKAASAAMASGAAQATGKLVAMTRATAQAANAQRNLETAARSASGAGAAGVEKTTSALARLRAMASAAGTAVSAGLSRAASSAAHAASSIGRAGKAAGKDFARGIGDAVKAELPGMIRGGMQSAWARITGRELLSGQGAIRGNMQSLAARGIQQGGVAARAASAIAYSNVQGAINIDEQLRPDLGAEGARRARQAADAWLLQSPFRRDDVRAALPDAARNGALPGSNAWSALMDAAASQHVTPAQATAAWAAMKKGEYSQLGQFGLNVKTGDDGNASSLSYMSNGAMKSVDVAGDIDAKVQAALNERFGGAADRKSLSMDGVVTRGINTWESFLGKIMDAGPYEFVNKKLQEILQTIEKIGGSAGADGLAKSLGGDIVAALEAAYKGVTKFLTGIVAIGRAINPVVQALGGWENVIAALLALKFSGWIIAAIAPLGMLAGGLARAAMAARGFAAALAANPVTWIVAGLVALAAAAYLVYRNWDSIGPKLTAIWESLKAAAEAAWEGLKAKAAEIWGGIVEAVRQAVKDVQAAASDGWDDVTTAVEAAWIGVKETASEAWGDLAKIVGDALDKVSQTIVEWGSKALTAIQTAWTPVSDWLDKKIKSIGEMWDGVKSGASKLAARVGFGDKKAAAEEDAIERAGKAAEAVKLMETLLASMTALKAVIATFDLAAPLNAAVAAARSTLAGVSFHSEGVAMMRTLADGIRAGSSAAVSAVQETVQKIRDHLPHSPAKVGPLSDLDQVRFSETLAGAIERGAPKAIAAVRSLAGDLASGVAPREPAFATAQSGASNGRPQGAGADASTANVNVTFNVTNNGGGDDLMTKLKEQAYEVAEIVKREMKRRSRTEY